MPRAQLSPTVVTYGSLVNVQGFAFWGYLGLGFEGVRVEGSGYFRYLFDFFFVVG